MSKKTKKILGYTIFTIFITIVATVTLVIVGNTIYIQRVYLAAQKEYDELREIKSSRIEIVKRVEIDEETATFSLSDAAATDDIFSNIDISGSMRSSVEELSEINPDFIGWIYIEGTRIDYPVVQGVDNKRYMNTTFKGTRSRAGAIFMDVRNHFGWETPLVVLYGHNSSSGAMFAGLRRELLGEYIYITTRNDELLLYRIIDVVRTTVHDSAYQLIGSSERAVANYLLDYDVPEGSNRMLLLSTCTDTNSDDDRLIVIAVRYG